MNEVRDHKGQLFFIGAGASFPPPSRLPLFAHLRMAIVEGLDPQLRGRIGAVGPEQLLRSLMLAGVPVDQTMLDVFNSAEARPNAVHYTLAHRLLLGDVVWTTNYDTLIEDALEGLASSRTVYDDAMARLEKPHGTLLRNGPGRWCATQGLVFHADQVLIEWSKARSEALLGAANGRRIALLGYSGVDVNSYRALRAALSRGTAIRWFWYAPGRESTALTDVMFRFPELDEEDLEPSDNPSRRFVEQFGADLDFATRTPLTDDEVGCPSPSRTAADVDLFAERVAAPAVQAIVARELGERITEQRMLNAAIRQAIGDGRRHEARRLLVSRVRLLRHARAISAMRAAGRSFALRMPAWVPTSQRVRSRAIAGLTLRSRRHADVIARRTARWASGADHPLYRARLFLELSRVLRFCGLHAEALKPSGEALRLTREAEVPLVTEAARAEIEHVEALRSLGRFDDALETIRLRLHTLGMAHWGAWLDYEHGCIDLQLRDFPKARLYLDRSARFFGSIDPLDPETAYDPTQGQHFVRLAQAAVARCAGTPDETARTLEETRRHPRYARAGPLLVSSVEFQAGELARARQQWEKALHHYLGMATNIEIYGGLSMLGQALCALGRGEPDQARLFLERSARAFEDQQSIFGLSYVLLIESELSTHSLSVGPDLREIAMEETTRLRGRLEETTGAAVDPSFQIAFT